MQTGDGKAYIPPDKVLERVASILGATCTGLTVMFGGDGENDTAVRQVPSEVIDLQPQPGPPQGCSGSVLGNHCGGGKGASDTNITQKKLFSNTPNKIRK